MDNGSEKLEKLVEKGIHINRNTVAEDYAWFNLTKRHKAALKQMRDNYMSQLKAVKSTHADELLQHVEDCSTKLQSSYESFEKKISKQMDKMLEKEREVNSSLQTLSALVNDVSEEELLSKLQKLEEKLVSFLSAPNTTNESFPQRAPVYTPVTSSSRYKVESSVLCQVNGSLVQCQIISTRVAGSSHQYQVRSNTGDKFWILETDIQHSMALPHVAPTSPTRTSHDHFIRNTTDSFHEDPVTDGMPTRRSRNSLQSHRSFSRTQFSNNEYEYPLSSGIRYFIDESKAMKVSQNWSCSPLGFNDDIRDFYIHLRHHVRAYNVLLLPFDSLSPGSDLLETNNFNTKNFCNAYKSASRFLYNVFKSGVTDGSIFQASFNLPSAALADCEEDSDGIRFVLELLERRHPKFTSSSILADPTKKYTLPLLDDSLPSYLKDLKDYVTNGAGSVASPFQILQLIDTQLQRFPIFDKARIGIIEIFEKARADSSFTIPDGYTLSNIRQTILKSYSLEEQNILEGNVSEFNGVQPIIRKFRRDATLKDAPGRQSSTGVLKEPVEKPCRACGVYHPPPREFECKKLQSLLPVLDFIKTLSDSKRESILNDFARDKELFQQRYKKAYEARSRLKRTIRSLSVEHGDDSDLFKSLRDSAIVTRRQIDPDLDFLHSQDGFCHHSPEPVLDFGGVTSE